MPLRSLLLVLTASSLHAQTITGLDDEETYDDQVTFTVEDEPGATVTAHLNSSPIPVGTAYTVTKMDFHQLVTTRTPNGTTTTGSRMMMPFSEGWGFTAEIVPMSTQERAYTSTHWYTP